MKTFVAFVAFVARIAGREPTDNCQPGRSTVPSWSTGNDEIVWVFARLCDP